MSFLRPPNRTPMRMDLSSPVHLLFVLPHYRKSPYTPRPFHLFQEIRVATFRGWLQLFLLAHIIGSLKQRYLAQNPDDDMTSRNRRASAATPTKGVGDQMAVTLCNGLILAEFDIDRGACARSYYPKSNTAAGMKKPIGVNVPGQAEYFASHMLPDGAEKVTVGRTVFVVNRPKMSPCVRFPVYRFRRSTTPMGERWERHYCGHGDPLVTETLFVNRTTGDFALHFKDTVLLDTFPLLEDDFHVQPISPDGPVNSFVKQLENTTDTGVAVTGTAAQSSRTNSTLAPPRYGLVVLRAPNGMQEGLCMEIANIQAMIEVRRLALKPPSPGPQSVLTAAPEPSAVRSELNPVGARAGAEPSARPAHSTGTPLSAAVPDECATLDSPMNVSNADGEDGGPKGWVVAHPSAASEVPSGVALSAPGTGCSTAAHQDPTAGSSANGVADDVSPPQAAIQAQCPKGLATPATSGGGEFPAVLSPPHVSTSSTTRTPRPTSPAVSTALMADSATPVEEEECGETLYGLCAVVSKRDSSARRGGVTKSVAILGPSLVWLEPYFPILVETAQYCCDIPGADSDAIQQQTKVLKVCYDAITAAGSVVARGMANTTRLIAEVERYSTSMNGGQSYVTLNTSAFGKMRKVRIPLSPDSSDITFTRFGLEGLLELLGPQFIHLVHGIMCEKRIVVMARKGFATDVAEATLALGLLGNLLDSKFLARKVFPYASVGSVDLFQSLPGYIIGTPNPIFENEKVWRWDLFCDLDRQHVIRAGEATAKKSNSLPSFSSATAGLASAMGGVGDMINDVLRDSTQSTKSLSPQAADLFRSLMSSISNMRALRYPIPERNRRLRLMIEEYMHAIAMISTTAGTDVVLPPSLRTSFATDSISSLCTQFTLTTMADSVRHDILYPSETPSLILLCTALRRCHGCDTPTVLQLLSSIQKELTSDEAVYCFLRRMPLATGGLNPVAMQLTHCSVAVRRAALSILNRVEDTPAGKAAVSSMNSFLVMTYQDSTKRYLLPR